MRKLTISIVVPTYNERGNIEKLVPLIFQNCKTLKAKVQVVIVDDNSPDGTGKLAEQLGRKYNVKTIHRPGKLGLASAAIKAFSETKSDMVGLMDADLSHPPHILPKLIRPIIEGKADLVIGSRYVKGGGVEVWPLHRRLISKLATLLAYPLTPVKDPMSGLFFFRRKILDGVSLNAKGYKIGLEVIVKARYGKLLEVPYLFQNRFVGKSKLTSAEYLHYIRNLIVLAAYKIKHNASKQATSK